MTGQGRQGDSVADMMTGQAVMSEAMIEAARTDLVGSAVARLVRDYWEKGGDTRTLDISVRPAPDSPVGPGTVVVHVIGHRRA